MSICEQCGLPKSFSAKEGRGMRASPNGQRIIKQIIDNIGEEEFDRIMSKGNTQDDWDEFMDLALQPEGRIICPEKIVKVNRKNQENNFDN